MNELSYTIFKKGKTHKTFAWKMLTAILSVDDLHIVLLKMYQ